MSDLPIKRDGVSEYVRRVHESTQQYARDVLAENERLGGVVTALYEEKLRLVEQIARLEANSQAFTTRYVEVEQQNSSLASLYVASYRLHGSLEREDVLGTLREILINLIGTEEFAVFEAEPGNEGAPMQCATSFGVDPSVVESVRIGEGRLGEAIGRGVPYVPPGQPVAIETGRPVTACVPLRVGNLTMGAIVVYRLLAHKPALEAADLELFNLLATHGATALYCSTLHAQKGRAGRA
jgi:hypothetical protein